MDKHRGSRDSAYRDVGIRGLRLEELFREELNAILDGELADPRFEGTRVRFVELCRDGSRARIWFSRTEYEPGALSIDALEMAFERASGFIRGRLCEALPLKRMPELCFRHVPALSLGPEKFTGARVMSTKNLARTVIEGGRHRQNIWQRRLSNSEERTSERQLMFLLRDRGDADAVVHRKRTPVYRGFDDKLRPALRWLEAQAGRPWNKVRSELFARFDTRTTAGRHIVFDHLLQSVEHEPNRFARRHEFNVDRHGILRKVPYRRKGPRREPLPEAATEIQAWLAGRRVTLHGDVLYWFVATSFGYFRQDKALSLPEKQRLLALPEWYRKLLAQQWAIASATQEST